MAMFTEITTQLGFLNTAVLAMFLFGPGLSPLPQTTPGAPATCDAPYTFYERVALLHNLFLGAVLVSCGLGSHARRMVAAAEAGDGGGLQAMEVGARLRARGCLLVAILFSAVAAGMAVTVYTYILQIKYVVFSCMPAEVRYVVFGMDIIISVACIYTYWHMVRAVILSD